ncbi:MAG TPA: hypothetical protein VMW52_10720 [Phycisphaerae bacterium]|nr:hypothetical protein [Phycisphaerae bacterium]
MFERIGGMIGLAFYAAQVIALGGGLAVMAFGGKGAGEAWLGWTLPPMIGLAMAAVYGLPAVGAVARPRPRSEISPLADSLSSPRAMALWKVFKEG